MQPQQLLDVLARLRADGLQHCAVLADDDALVRVAFAVNRRVDFHKVVVHLLHAHHFHADAVRHFVAQMLERLLANQLGTNQPLRLVGHHVVREILRAFRQVRGKLLRQVIQPVAGFGADGDNRVIAKVSEGRNQPQQLFRRQQVNLVDCQHLRHFLARHITDDGAVVFAHLRRVHQHQHAIHAVHRVLDGLHHTFAQLRAGRVDAGGVEEHNLPVRARHHAHNAVARRLRAAGDNRNFLANHRVH